LQATHAVKIQFKLVKKTSSSNSKLQTREFQKSSADRFLPPIYLLLIFANLQFEILSLMNLIFSLFQTCVLQVTAFRKIQFKLGKKFQFIKLNISNWRIEKRG
jgi:hypothetical protein